MISPEGANADRWIKLLIERAPELRRAGITRLTLASVSVELAPFTEPAAPAASSSSGGTTAPAPGEAVPPALDDPATYADGIVPGWTIEHLTEE
jgi:hypothetical protein